MDSQVIVEGSSLITLLARVESIVEKAVENEAALGISLARVLALPPRGAASGMSEPVARTAPAGDTLKVSMSLPRSAAP